MNEFQVERLQEFYSKIQLKLDPLQIILQNLTTYLTNNFDKEEDLLDLNQQVRKKINNILKLSNKFLSVTITPKMQNQQEDLILFEILDNMLKELQFEEDISSYITFNMEEEIKDEAAQEMLEEEVNILKMENHQLKLEIQQWHSTINEGQMNLSQDVSELIACLTEKDKVIETLQKNQCRLLEKQKQDANFESRLGQLNTKLVNFDKLYQQLEKRIKQQEESYQRQLLYNSITIDSLREQIVLFKQRMKKIKKRIPFLFKKDDNPQISNIYQVLLQLEEETFKIHQNYQQRIATYTLENNDLRIKVNSLEKIVNALSQSQSDNSHIIQKMKSQGEKINELQFQNEQMREFLKDKNALEKRIKELIKQQEQDTKEQKKREKEKKKEEKQKKEEKNKK